ncbi:MAG: pilin [Cardiobacteriaceae bacterium]|nr:pilin [Cardiobacteriaceae bacterium]
MAATHNYYRILNIPSTAGVPEIIAALNALRKKDTTGNYTATLNTIENTLTDPQKRAAYDDELNLAPGLRGDYYVAIQAQEAPKARTFVDVSGKEYASERELANAQKARYNRMTVELEEWEKSVASRNRFLSLGRTFLFLFLLAAALLVGYFSGKPFYDDYRAKQQTENAYIELSKAGKSVMDYIRANKVFPTTVPDYPREGDYYDVSMTSDNSIQLTFNQNAVDGLAGSTISFEPYQIPNAGLDWRCRASVPAKYIPVRCPIN